MKGNAFRMNAFPLIGQAALEQIRFSQQGIVSPSLDLTACPFRA